MASTDKDYQRRRGTSSIYSTYTDEELKEFAEARYEMLLKWVEETMGHTEMTWDSELREFIADETYLKSLIGVFGRTEGMSLVDRMEPGESMIVNTKDAPGEHWVAFHRFASGNIFMYDSFGREYTELFNPDDSSVDNTEEDVEQDMVEDNCGQRCIAWLLVAADGEQYAKWI